MSYVWRYALLVVHARKEEEEEGERRCAPFMPALKWNGTETIQLQLEMWANAQRDGRPVEYRWRPVFNAAVWLCSNAAKTRNPLKFAGVTPN